MQANCELMREKARDARVSLRPHVKTHKTVEGARMQLGAATGPITVSTMAEAEFFASHGFDDITLAVPLPPARIDRAIALTRRVRRFSLLVDDPAMLALMESASGQSRVQFAVWVEIDSGAGRTGLDPRSPDTLLFIRELAQARSTRFEGLLTHGGHAYRETTHGGRTRVAREEIDTLLDLKTRLGTLGVPVPAISVGSTPGLTALENLAGCDEIRPGNYIFFDANQVGLGSCTVEQVAASVLTTVIGVYPRERRLVVDAGSLALTHEPPAPGASGWGIACDLDGEPLPFTVTALTQEHGILEYTPLAPPPSGIKGYDERRAIGGLKLGSMLRIVPNHSCITAAMYERYHVIDRREVVDEWVPAGGW